MRREMLKDPAVMRALEPLERAIFLASTDKIIAAYSGRELSAELETTLRWIAKDIGYRVTDEGDRQYMVVRTAEILKRYYNNFTLKDFRMAFEMSLTGALDDYLPRGRDGLPDRNHYQQFNAEYVCKILNAYKARRGWVMKKANEARPKVQAEIPAADRAAARAFVRRDCIMAFYHYKYRGFLPTMSSVAELLYCEMLAACGLGDPVEITADDQREVFRRAVYDYARRGMVYDAARLKGEGPDARELHGGSRSVARRRAIVSAFERMAKDEIQITDYITI